MKTAMSLRLGLIALLLAAAFPAHAAMKHVWFADDPGGIPPDPQLRCKPTASPDLNQNCVRPLTGCVCSITGTITTSSFANCGGCRMVVDGTLNCTFAHAPPETIPATCDITVYCQDSGTCGFSCPCTGGMFYPFKLDCAECPHGH